MFTAALLAPLEEDKRLLLAVMSQADEFTAEMARAVTGLDGARALLRELTGQNAFITHLPDGRTYRFHHMLKSCAWGNVRRTYGAGGLSRPLRRLVFHAWRSAARAAVLRQERKRSGLAANSRGGCGRTARIRRTRRRSSRVWIAGRARRSVPTRRRCSC